MRWRTRVPPRRTSSSATGRLTSTLRSPTPVSVPGRSERRGDGLTGMRQRVLFHEGRLEAGPRPGGGFLVRASLPLRAPGS